MSEAVARYKENGAYVVSDNGPCSEDDLRAFVTFARKEKITRFDSRALMLWLKDQGIDVDVFKVAFYLRRLNLAEKLETIGIRILPERIGTKRVYEIIIAE